MNERQILNWTGKMGRNEEGRIPYFKTGIYNPGGVAQPGEVWVRNFAYNCSEPPCADAELKSDDCIGEDISLNQLSRERPEIVPETDENDVLSRQKRARRDKNKKDKKTRKKDKEKGKRKREKKEKEEIDETTQNPSGIQNLNFELTELGAKMGSCRLRAYGKAVYTNLERELVQEIRKENHSEAIKKLVDVLEAHDRRTDMLENKIVEQEKGFSTLID